MGKKLDAIFGRTFKSYRFKSLVNLAISRLAIFKNQRQVRCNHAQSDVVQLLEQGHHESALLRVDHVIKEQKMLDVYVMMEGYCNLLVERVHLIEQQRECPDELKEAISSLLYASSRCGDFPELQEIRALFTTRYGKEFAACAIELRNNCGVNPKMIQKLSTRAAGLENRMNVLKEIASEHGLTRQLEEGLSATSKEKLDENKKQDQPKPEMESIAGGTKLADNLRISPEDIEKDGFSDSMRARKKYRDVADAAQAAFESAAYAADAARAAVELSRSDPYDPDNRDSSNNRGKKASYKDEPVKGEPESENQGFNLEDRAAESKTKTVSRSASTSSSASAEENLKVTTTLLDAEDPAKLLEKDIVFDESDDEVHGSGLSIKSKEKSNDQIPSTSRSGIRVDSRHGYPTTDTAKSSEIRSSQFLNIEKRPISARTRRVRGF